MIENRFKYRVWDAKRNRMYPVHCLYWNGEVGVHTEIGTRYYNSDNNDIVLMQCTGLKDRNGTLIWEGDIIKWYVNEVIRYAPVIFETGMFWMGKDKNDHMVCNDWLRGEYEVIGNIFENINLLQVLK